MSLHKARDLGFILFWNKKKKQKVVDTHNFFQIKNYSYPFIKQNAGKPMIGALYILLPLVVDFKLIIHSGPKTEFLNKNSFFSAYKTHVE